MVKQETKVLEEQKGDPKIPTSGGLIIKKARLQEENAKKIQQKDEKILRKLTDIKEERESEHSLQSSEKKKPGSIDSE